MGFFTRDKDPRPFVDEQDVAISVLYFLWRDDILVGPDEHPGVAKLLVLDHFPNHKEKICAELFCLRFIAGKMGVTMGMSDVVKRKTICSYMEAVQLSMTGERVNPDSTNDATLVTLRRAFIEYIAEARSGDVKWAEGVERTQSYVPAFSLLKERIENTSTFLIRNAPNLEMAFQEIAIDFCGRVNAPDREQVQAGAFAYLSMWMNMVKDFMPMYRMKGNGSG